MNGHDELIVTEDRGKTYGFLSGLCLRPPSEEIIAMLQDKSILDLFPKDENDGSCFSEMAGFLAAASGIKNLSDELTAEHSTLFVLPSKHLPHEAVFLDSEKRLGGRITISVGQFYEKAGADIHDRCIDMPDHIGMELEFMAFLCRIEKEMRLAGDDEALKRCIDLEKTFLNEHLLKWVYDCCKKIKERAAYGFYRAIACLIADFMKAEEEYIADMHIKVCVKGEEICGIII